MNRQRNMPSLAGYLHNTAVLEETLQAWADVFAIPKPSSIWAFLRFSNFGLKLLSSYGVMM